MPHKKGTGESRKGNMVGDMVAMMGCGKGKGSMRFGSTKLIYMMVGVHHGVESGLVVAEDANILLHHEQQE